MNAELPSQLHPGRWIDLHVYPAGRRRQHLLQRHHQTQARRGGGGAIAGAAQRVDRFAVGPHRHPRRGRNDRRLQQGLAALRRQPVAQRPGRRARAPTFSRSMSRQAADRPTFRRSPPASSRCSPAGARRCATFTIWVSVPGDAGTSWSRRGFCTRARPLPSWRPRTSPTSGKPSGRSASCRSACSRCRRTSASASPQSCTTPPRSTWRPSASTR